MILFVCDAFVEQYQGGGELTTEAIIEASYFPAVKLLSHQVTVEIMEKHKNSYWIFGNFSNLDKKCILYALKNLDYSIIEYDYKFCKYRSSKKHIEIEGFCNCEQSIHGKLIATFFAKSKCNFWMSRAQLKKYETLFPFLKNEKNTVLSSVFNDSTLDYLSKANTDKKNNKWVILDSPSWIKGKEAAIEYAKNNNLEYELVWNLSYEKLLNKLASSKGLIFLPLGADTCPRLVIEAKLLGCEIISNDNVQHAKEDWFKTKESILSYLSTSGERFWRKIEQFASKNLHFRPEKTEKGPNFKVITPFYNAEQWIGKCIDSLKSQYYKNFECYLVDDISDDNSYEIAKKAIQGDKRFKITKNKHKSYALANIVQEIENSKCGEEDVVIILDGDDWLASSYSLDTLASTYNEENCLMTYGSYVYSPSGARGVEPSQYPEQVVEENNYRQDTWRASHLRSFKYKLWKNLKKQDLKDEDGFYYKMAYDQAIMLPLLEMAGDRAKYVKETLHVYNKNNPLNVDKIKALEQADTAKKIRNKKKYQRIK